MINGLTDNAEVIEMFSEMVNPDSVVNNHDKSLNSICLRLGGRKTYRLLG